MNRYVLDASALIAYLLHEDGAKIVEQILLAPLSECLAHSINFCEVFYAIRRGGGEVRAQRAVSALTSNGIRMMDDIHPDFWMRVGRKKAAGGISLPDCFCLTLAEELGAVCITADRSEFMSVVKRVKCNIQFIR